MNAKLISENSRHRTSLIILPFTVKVVIAIILASLSIILIAMVLQIPIKLTGPASLTDRFKSVYFNSSMETSAQPGLTGDRKDVPLLGDLNNEIPGKAESTLIDPQIQQGTTRISIKIDQYPFFADEFDHNIYE